jgi:DNA polymerase-3 subunit delta'
MNNMIENISIFVLYYKGRQVQFKNIPGREKEKNILKNLVSDSLMPHASLFLGRKGSAALALAYATICALFCSEKTADGDSCGNCTQCKKTYSFTHPDIHFSFPVIKHESKKREDTTSRDFLPEWRKALQLNIFMDIHDWQIIMGGAGSKPNINTKECFEIIHNLSLRAFEGGIKLQLIWLPEYLGKEGNRLLKLIEEPSENTYLVLIAENQNLILNTILSRCQLFRIPPYQESEMMEYLKAKYMIPEQKARQIAKLSEGSINEAHKLLEDQSNSHSDKLFEWLRQCFRGSAADLLKFSQDFADWKNDDQLQFIEYSLHFFREILFWKLTGVSKPELSDSEVEVASKIAGFLTPEMIELISERLEFTLSSIGRNANTKVLIMAESFSIGEIMKKKEFNYHLYSLIF